MDCSLANGCTYLAQNMLETEKNRSQVEEAVRTVKINKKEYVLTGKKSTAIDEVSIINFLGDKDHYRS